jgi:hypothetical protein
VVKLGAGEGYPLAAHSLRQLSQTHAVSRSRSHWLPGTDVEHAALPAEYERERSGKRIERRPYRRFTQDEDARIEALRLQGLGCKKIGRLLHRARSSVQFRLRLLAEVAELRLLMEATTAEVEAVDVSGVDLPRLSPYRSTS